ncbi:dimethylhistidine N-methyltransferase [Fodinibius roseus]|uniref:Dimethylhistidine N-methyltransferase n=1 Tax=Fodinibius roseus TaxID=1194090 RepID=A0A1M5HVC4_9BACT|nr:L-histidine N(alpha)-methyltransferase [Fodinibius roseus]SHG19921.1 dimethylhistidine N-methyltransferase [Fodinibius roseus]
MENQVKECHPTMLEEVLDGLRKPQKKLPSKYFYDERGSQLFEQITRLDEYYPTRTEVAIMRENMPEIIRQIGRDVVLVELGSGSSEKTKLLLDHLPHVTAYIPVEISEKFLSSVVEHLRKKYPDLSINPVYTDYTRPFQVPDIEQPYDHFVVFYPGSTIGNFHPRQARQFLATISTMLEPGGGMLIGVDLKKDNEVLERAYNDKQGLTARFNKNILRHINRELDADFSLDKFRHCATYNEGKGRIEMHLVSKTDQEVTVAGEQFHFIRDESIHTENSYKYALKEFEELVSDWFTVENVWTDQHNYFSLQYLQNNIS